MISTIVLAVVMGCSMPELNAVDHDSVLTPVQEHAEELDPN